MNCIVVDDEPLAREGMEILIEKVAGLTLLGSFNNAESARKFMANNVINLIFLDIQMPGTNGIEFAKSINPKTLVIFTTAHVEFALDSYEVDALDYLVKPVKIERFQKATEKAFSYLHLLETVNTTINLDNIAEEYFFVKADRKIFKVTFKDILVIEGLKDYVILHTADQKIITAMNIKTIYDKLPKNIFVRVSKSYIVNVSKIESFDNNTLFIKKHEIPIGDTYRNFFFEEFINKKLFSR